MEKVNRLYDNLRKEADKQEQLARQWSMFEKHQIEADIHQAIADAFNRVIEKS